MTIGKRRTFLTDHHGLLAAATEILTASLWPMTLRQVYYQLVVLELVKNIHQEYRRVGDALKKARLRGQIPYEKVIDATRTYMWPDHGHGTPESFIASIKDLWESYRADPWNGQDRIAIGICEKEGMNIVLDRICSQMTDTYPRVRFTANHGFGSVDIVHTTATSISAEARFRHVTLLYFGDFDPSGEVMCPSPSTMAEFGEEGDLVTRLREQGCRDFDTIKVALSDEQFWQWFNGNGQDRLPLNPNPLKKDKGGNYTDSRGKWFAQRYGEYGAELDAVPEARLRSLLKEQLDRLIDKDAYRKTLERQARDQKRIEQALANLELPA